jgi:hypothetical protein
MAASAAAGVVGAADPAVDGDVADGAVAAVADGGAFIHGAGLTALELGPISSVLSGVEDEGAGAIMLDGADPKPPPPKLGLPADGAIVAPRSFKSCAGETGTLKVGW